MSSAIGFNLGRSKVLSSDKGISPYGINYGSIVQDIIE